MTGQPKDITVTVTFATAPKPFREDFEPRTQLSVVLDAALKEFGITADGTTRYYLLHKDDEPALTVTLADLAGHAHAVHLRLRTETTQG
ncbi:hypothetical protein Lesp02_42160 [Lentzea sp. NBRC 105346]|uniref:hypothetical protein n=1 Tax=Lentzea sp. NBRC 105346 TaxID=3032205 RepID=UPI00249FA4B2|nr:hypothetical protein [Lentzea sp. NBRC 105346]GLZ32028.1 hypothetical protein Lesp02_42160 [Lentzea sp. NBRC 105346]